MYETQIILILQRINNIFNFIDFCRLKSVDLSELLKSGEKYFFGNWLQRPVNDTDYLLFGE